MIFLKGKRIISPEDINTNFSRIICPTPILLDHDTIRVFVGFCDIYGVSRPGYVDLNSKNPTEIIKVHSTPLLDIGSNGRFDDNGLCPTCIIKEKQKYYFIYYAFQQLVKIPFYMFTGLASSNDLDSSWKRESNVPLLDRSNEEPLMRSGAFILKDNKKYKIYYPCGYDFINVNGKLVHTYQIHYAESDNLKIWPSKGKPVILFQNEDEYGFGRPYVFIINEKYYMLYSIRTKSKGYRLGYATSDDGIDWNRKDDLRGLESGKKGEWDSDMLCYSSFIKTPEKSYLFYNGNNLGATGFGYAELIDG